MQGENKRIKYPGYGIIANGNCIELLDNIKENSIDMVLIDPPYSSGGMFSGDRKKSTKEKYTDDDYNGASRFENFSGDNMDMLALQNFLTLIFIKIRNTMKEGKGIFCFIDWRNITAVINSIQMAGFIYRGILVWNKGNSRNIQNRFRNDCEFVVWGTNGPDDGGNYKEIRFISGNCFSVSSVQSKDKNHQTEKPVELLKKILVYSRENDTVLDCFCGSGSTAVACVETGRKFVCMEQSFSYFENSCKRIEKAIKQKELYGDWI